jgi:hypothetical protein
LQVEHERGVAVRQTEIEQPHLLALCGQRHSHIHGGGRRPYTTLAVHEEHDTALFRRGRRFGWAHLVDKLHSLHGHGHPPPRSVPA